MDCGFAYEYGSEPDRFNCVHQKNWLTLFLCDILYSFDSPMAEWYFMQGKVLAGMYMLSRLFIVSAVSDTSSDK